MAVKSDICLNELQVKMTAVCIAQFCPVRSLLLLAQQGDGSVFVLLRQLSGNVIKNKDVGRLVGRSGLSSSFTPSNITIPPDFYTSYKLKLFMKSKLPLWNIRGNTHANRDAAVRLRFRPSHLLGFRCSTEPHCCRADFDCLLQQKHSSLRTRLHPNECASDLTVCFSPREQKSSRRATFLSPCLHFTQVTIVRGYYFCTAW